MWDILRVRPVADETEVMLQGGERLLVTLTAC